MQKRVGLARAVAADPEIIFFDEPTTGLDPIMADVINNLIVCTVKDVGATTLSITHDMTSARKIADRIAMLYKGKIIWDGPTAEIDTCGNPYVDQFIHGREEGPIRMEVRKHNLALSCYNNDDSSKVRLPTPETNRHTPAGHRPSPPPSPPTPPSSTPGDASGAARQGEICHISLPRPTPPSPRPPLPLPSLFVCQACGAVHSKWSGKCEACGAWNTIVEEVAGAPAGWCRKRVNGRPSRSKI